MTNIIYVDDDEETLISLNNLGFFCFDNVIEYQKFLILNHNIILYDRY